MEFYFDYDDSNGNIYDIYSDYLLTQDATLLTKLPRLFAEFLDMQDENDTRFEEFLNTILKLLGRNYTDEPVYKGANILTVMCCGIFHLCKMHHMMNMNTGFNHTTETLYLPTFTVAEKLMSLSHFSFRLV
jgi:hypothetical protein